MKKVAKGFFDINPLYFMWVLVIIPKIAVLGLSILWIIGYYLNHRATLKHTVFKYFVAMFVLHVVAVLLSFINAIPDASRLFAALNTSLMWLIAGYLYCIFKAHKFSGRSFYKASKFNLNILLLLTVVGLVFAKLNLNISIFGRNLVIDDWNNGKLVDRLNLFFEYTTLLPIFAIINFSFMSHYLFRMNKIVKLGIYGVLLFVAIYFSNSRAGMILMLALLFVILVRYFRLKKHMKLRTIVIIVVIGLALASPLVVNKAIQLFTQREGSNSMRMFIYTESITYTFTHNFLLGSGVKTMIGEYDYPLGSHSTIIGMFYKIGLIGLIVFLGLYIFIIVSSVKSFKKCFTVAIAVLLILVNMFVEDIDGTNWLMLYFPLMLSWLNFANKKRLVKRVRVIRRITYYEALN